MHDFSKCASWIYYVRHHILHTVVMIVLFLQIFLGLREILGKQIPVGVDNMTWTLLKPMMSDSHDVEAMTENYSKLNVALGVIHECFQPVKEPHTQRDLVEDVIFNRG